MARAEGGPKGASAGAFGERRLAKGQRRMLTILTRIPLAREQLIVAMEDISPTFELAALITAAESSDARERNKVDTVERGTEKLINWMWELASRALSEGVRLGTVTKEGAGSPWQRLADEKAISQATADRLREAKDTRNDLAHAYPPDSYSAVHDATSIVISELDAYMTAVSDWAVQNRILPQPTQSR